MHVCKHTQMYVYLFIFIMYLCRPGVPGAPLPARAILSMGGLSHGVIRVNTEDKNSALTVQDVGHVMPGGKENTEPLRHPRMNKLSNS